MRREGKGIRTTEDGDVLCCTRDVRIAAGKEWDNLSIRHRTLTDTVIERYFPDQK